MVVKTAFLCPLSRKLMENPVVTPCRHTFEKEEIIRWLRHGSPNCPLCAREVTQLTGDPIERTLYGNVIRAGVDLNTRIQDARLTSVYKTMLTRLAQMAVAAMDNRRIRQARITLVRAMNSMTALQTVEAGITSLREMAVRFCDSLWGRPNILFYPNSELKSIFLRKRYGQERLLNQFDAWRELKCDAASFLLSVTEAVVRIATAVFTSVYDTTYGVLFANRKSFLHGILAVPIAIRSLLPPVIISIGMGRFVINRGALGIIHLINRIFSQGLRFL